MLLTVNHNTNCGSVQLNGTEIVTFPLSGEGWEALVNNSKFKGWGFGEFKTVKLDFKTMTIASFRNIKIKEL